MFRCMRTTLTIDDELALRLKRLQAERKATLKAIVNELLREGLDQLEQGDQGEMEPYHLEPWFGRPRIHNLDDVAEVLAQIEGDSHP